MPGGGREGRPRPSAARCGATGPVLLTGSDEVPVRGSEAHAHHGARVGSGTFDPQVRALCPRDADRAGARVCHALLAPHALAWFARTADSVEDVLVVIAAVGPGPGPSPAGSTRPGP